MSISVDIQSLLDVLVTLKEKGHQTAVLYETKESVSASLNASILLSVDGSPTNLVVRSE